MCTCASYVQFTAHQAPWLDVRQTCCFPAVRPDEHVLAVIACVCGCACVCALMHSDTHTQAHISRLRQNTDTPSGVSTHNASSASLRDPLLQCKYTTQGRRPSTPSTPMGTKWLHCSREPRGLTCTQRGECEANLFVCVLAAYRHHCPHF